MEEIAKGLNFNSSHLKNISIPNHRPFRVSIEGNIGAGKSTLIKHFSSTPNIETYPEPIDEWRNLNGHNLLELLYTDIHKWANTFQTYVQLTRLKIQTSKPKVDTLVQMFERSVQNNRYCFMEQAFLNGFINEVDYSVLIEWYNWISSNMDITLDLIVYLRTSPDVVYERTKQRGRPEETGITLLYLTQLHESYEKWLMSKETSNKIPVLVLDANTSLQDLKRQYEINEGKILGRGKYSEDLPRKAVN